MESSTTFADPQFVTRIQDGDPEAIEAVVHTYLPQVLRAARASGLNTQTAEDVTQETFATFIEKAGTFEGRSHVRTWIFGIMYRKISEARRGHQRDDRLDDIDDVVEQRFASDGSWTRPPRSIDEQLYGEQVRERIDECLALAPTQQRMAFVFKEVEQLDSEEVCNILDVTRTNLGVMLYRVRNRLRECLESKGVRG